MRYQATRWVCDRCQHEIERPYGVLTDVEILPGWGRVEVSHRLTTAPRHLIKDLCGGCVRTVLDLLDDGGPS